MNNHIAITSVVVAVKLAETNEQKNIRTITNTRHHKEIQTLNNHCQASFTVFKVRKRVDAFLLRKVSQL